MECNKWEETGLLYVARELNDHAATAFEIHCKECSCCAELVESYRRDKSRFFRLDILCEKPSARVDQAIENAAAHSLRIAGIYWNLFSGLKKAVVPVLLFVLGFGTGTYFVLNIQNAKTRPMAVAQSKTTSVAPVDSADSLRQLKMASHDSLKKPMDRPFNAPAGNASGQMVPVKE